MKLLAGLLTAASLYAAADRDMQRAIAWERHKERAAARQARIEKKRPSVTYTNNSADRSDPSASSNQVKDPGPRNQWSEKDKPAPEKK